MMFCFKFHLHILVFCLSFTLDRSCICGTLDNLCDKISHFLYCSQGLLLDDSQCVAQSCVNNMNLKLNSNFVSNVFEMSHFFLIFCIVCQ